MGRIWRRQNNLWSLVYLHPELHQLEDSDNILCQTSSGLLCFYSTVLTLLCTSAPLLEQTHQSDHTPSLFKEMIQSKSNLRYNYICPKVSKYRNTQQGLKTRISTLLLLIDKTDCISQDNLIKFSTILPAKGLIIFNKQEHNRPNIWRQHSNIWLFCYEDLLFASLNTLDCVK